MRGNTVIESKYGLYAWGGTWLFETIVISWRLVMIAGEHSNRNLMRFEYREARGFWVHREFLAAGYDCGGTQ